jgi:outer membrane immunogenic protein
MRRLYSRLVVAVSTLALVQIASAADLPHKAPVYTPPPPAVFSWAGFYVGGNAGWGWLHDSGETFCVNPAGALNGPGCSAQTATGDQIRGDGFIGGVQAGYNWQINNWVFGVEADFQDADIKGSIAAPIYLVTIVPIPPIVTATENASEKLEWFGTVRGRLGIAFDRVLIYGTGGMAYGHVKADQNSAPVGAPASFLFPSSESSTKIGWTAGGGIEWAFSGKWSTKIECLYYDLGSISSAGRAVNGFMVGKDFDVRGEIARVGLNYKFN